MLKVFTSKPIKWANKEDVYMADENKLEDTTNSTSQEEEVDAKPEAKESESDSKGSPTDNKIDYAAELAIERQKREDAERALAKKRFDDSEAKRQSDQENNDERLTPSRVEELIEKKTQVILKNTLESQANMLADKLASEPAEKELILERWKTRTFPAGMSLSEQIEETFVIVNGKKLISERNEAFRGLRGKEQVNDNAASTHHDSPKSKEPTVAPDVKQVLANQGFVYNNNARRYEKKLFNGKILVKDHITGKVFQEGMSQAPIGA